MGARICECGCGESLDGRPRGTRFFAPNCRTKARRPRCLSKEIDGKASVALNGGIPTRRSAPKQETTDTSVSCHFVKDAQPHHPLGKNAKQERKALFGYSQNRDTCAHCGAVGDARTLLYCADCRRLLCRQHMRRDVEGYYRCHRCAGKVKQADTPILSWIEEPIKAQLARAKGDARESKAVIKALRCVCGWGFNTGLGQGIVECRCGKAFRLADAEWIVATVGRSVKTKVGAGRAREG